MTNESIEDGNVGATDINTRSLKGKFIHFSRPEISFAIDPNYDSDVVKLPEYGTTEAAGADVRSAVHTIIYPGQHALIPTGLLCRIPKGYELQVRPRSGLALKHKVTVLNAPGTIDSDYTQGLGVMLINHGDKPFEVNVGDRIAQIVVAPVIRATFLYGGGAVRETNRTGGFGSTGIA